ncbi:MFS transporter [Mucilaginibacter hurinus]|uniref:MFS transporter n=1 Tax=Mucilaginibacter hurinus TaxID=2201324 RepID=A0A367GMQ9_9SPHI|nr:MFS transporter [Mucilaginibacter hurinus]RCH54772.1 MFS transporter [Mucilaginibacter hurinus]
MSAVKTNAKEEPNKLLFWACFVAIVTTSFGFILRAMTLPQWSADFNLTNTQTGEIAGVGLWPFAISIVLFSLIIDKVGYKNSMIFAFICHVLSAVVTWFADGYTMLYIGTFIMALGNGTVEAVTNPAVASMFPREKTKWLNFLHAGWPTGLILGGVMALLMGPETNWKIKILLVLLPAVLYGILMLGRKFPVNERVRAGVSYLEMLKEVGIGGALIIVGLIIFQIGSVFGWTTTVNVVVTLVIVALFGAYVRSFGQPLFIIMLLIMLPLAVTELGTDSWVSDLMAPAMEKIGLQGGWILIYTSAIMVILRFSAGSIVHRISPLGLLAVCSSIAAVGLYFLSTADGIMILVAATIFGLGKSFFWPTMLGVVAERLPKGGALTLNITGGVGMIGAGVIGTVILGFVQDKSIDNNLRAYDQKNNSALHSTYVTESKSSMFGDYQAINAEKLAGAPENDKAQVNTVQAEAKKGALKTVALFPIGMLVCYLLLIMYFKSKGGYKAVSLDDGPENEVPTRGPTPA